MASDEVDSGDWDLNELNQLLLLVIPLAPITGAILRVRKKAKDLTEKLTEKAVALYEAKEQGVPESGGLPRGGARCSVAGYRPEMDGGD